MGDRSAGAERKDCQSSNWDLNLDAQITQILIVLERDLSVAALDNGCVLHIGKGDAIFQSHLMPGRKHGERRRLLRIGHRIP